VGVTDRPTRHCFPEVVRQPPLLRGLRRAASPAPNVSPPSRGADSARGLHECCPSRREGAGNAGCALHPRSRVQKAQKNAHTSIQVQRRQSGIPCAMALRLMPCSPRRRIRLVTVAAGLMAGRIRLDRLVTDSLAPATGVGTTRFCRTQRAPFVLRAVNRSRVQPRPAAILRADALASTASPSRVRDDRDTPLLSRRDSPGITTDLG
jgi:hypothetical protein